MVISYLSDRHLIVIFLAYHSFTIEIVPKYYSEHDAIPISFISFSTQTTGKLKKSSCNILLTWESQEFTAIMEYSNCNDILHNHFTIISIKSDSDFIHDHLCVNCFWSNKSKQKSAIGMSYQHYKLNTFGYWFITMSLHIYAKAWSAQFFA